MCRKCGMTACMTGVTRRRSSMTPSFPSIAARNQEPFWMIWNSPLPRTTVKCIRKVSAWCLSSAHRSLPCEGIHRQPDLHSLYTTSCACFHDVQPSAAAASTLLPVNTSTLLPKPECVCKPTTGRVHKGTTGLLCSTTQCQKSVYFLYFIGSFTLWGRESRRREFE